MLPENIILFFYQEKHYFVVDITKYAPNGQPLPISEKLKTIVENKIQRILNENYIETLKT